MAISCLENPHFGAEGVPFMNSMIGAAVVNFLSLALSCSGVSFSGTLTDSIAFFCGVVGSFAASEAADVAVEFAAGADPNCSSALASSFGSAPLSSLRIVPFFTKTKYGTAEMSNKSEISGNLSAFTDMKPVLWFWAESAKVETTLFI